MKLRAFYLILLVALCVSLLPGCSAFAGKTAIGVIETSGSDATSQIVLFDKDLNKVSGFPLAEASLNSVFYDPVINQGILYAIPQGYAQEKEARKVLGISIQDGSVADYSIDQPAMNSAAVSDATFLPAIRSMGFRISVDARKSPIRLFQSKRTIRTSRTYS